MLASVCQGLIRKVCESSYPDSAIFELAVVERQHAQPFYFFYSNNFKFLITQAAINVLTKDMNTQKINVFSLKSVALELLM